MNLACEVEDKGSHRIDRGVETLPGSSFFIQCLKRHFRDLNQQIIVASEPRVTRQVAREVAGWQGTAVRVTSFL